ncbi:hypothetical protein EW146_g1813 [Bondarzewia mesenterica]|uniref:WW domain-containing protein n=1 Tax=Bondarzewia mesenterica TaxID=1095465 RepID=A0A4S4M2P0_9AGAM|nr:hypothetical protein EW146_g1813 [Bondarzewia mesenterica]
MPSSASFLSAMMVYFSSYFRFLARQIKMERMSSSDPSHFSFFTCNNATSDSSSTRGHCEAKVIAPSICPLPVAHVVPDYSDVIVSSRPIIIHRTPSRYGTLDMTANSAEVNGDSSDSRFLVSPALRQHSINGSSSSMLSGEEAVTVVSDARYSCQSHEPGSSPVHHGIYHLVEVKPIIPQWIDRYARNINVKKTVSRYNTVISPFRKSFCDPICETDWTTHVHPGGAKYFFNVQKQIYTDANPGNDKSLKGQGLGIDIALHHIEKKLKDHERIRSLDYGEDLVLELIYEEDQYQLWGYYFVDHNYRTIFWAEEFDTKGVFDEVEVVNSDAHLRHEFRSWYWEHCSLFPRASRFTSDDIQEALRTLMSGILDQTTSSGSLVPYPADTLKLMLETLLAWNGLGKVDDALIFHVARLLSYYAHAEFVHHHGETGARLQPGQSIYGHGEVERMSLAFRIVSILNFWSPTYCLRKLSSVTMDDIIIMVTWQSFIEEELKQWADVTIQYSTSGRQPGLPCNPLGCQRSQWGGGSSSGEGSVSTEWTAAQILSALSTFFLISSITNTFLLRGLYSSDMRSNIGQLARFFKSHRRSSGIFFEDLELMAVLHSIPFACLAWGAIFSALSFTSWSFESYGSATRALFVAALLLVVGCALLWIFTRNPNYIDVCKEWSVSGTQNMWTYLTALKTRSRSHRFRSSLRRRSDPSIQMGTRRTIDETQV